MSPSETTVGYSPMLQQFAPREAIAYAVEAETAGFSATLLSDYFQPWLPQQGNASYMWSVAGALCTRVRTPVLGITSPGYRSHPAVTAQAAATLAVLSAGNFMLGLGSGQALNEHIVGEYWPSARERIDRLFEATELIQRLLLQTRRDSRYDGEHYRLESSRLWTTPVKPPPVLLAVAGPVAARRAASVADGMITMRTADRRLEEMLDRFEEGVAHSSSAAVRHRMIQLHVSWADTRDQALSYAAEQWPQGGLQFPTADVRSPYDFARIVRHVRNEDLESRMLISADAQEHIEHIQHYANLGFDQIYVHNVGRNQSEFIDFYGQQVLPAVTG